MIDRIKYKWKKAAGTGGEAQYVREDGEWMVKKIVTGVYPADPRKPVYDKVEWGLYGPVERHFRYLTGKYDKLREAKAEADLLGECPDAWMKYGRNHYHGSPLGF